MGQLICFYEDVVSGTETGAAKSLEMVVGLGTSGSLLA